MTLSAAENRRSVPTSLVAKALGGALDHEIEGVDDDVGRLGGARPFGSEAYDLSRERRMVRVRFSFSLVLRIICATELLLGAPNIAAIWA